ncbi:hypothetical protein SH1V18_27470 [Vallitalea longa]|uniref:4'-phosphopantetheinyl transferase domain-containing protein n=1 Tax=Vallitalea longa TaxID=2936439 RepID=A0A9W5YB67_9FIRM|nr:4'-phosphopantetheinyl transferase superfamily protein [Vallitalea longa]GKX30267.1 hypothetical protein SH1V18_27470 [Vallitalea longa]
MKALAVIKNFTLNYAKESNMFPKERLERAKLFTDKESQKRFLIAEDLASKFTAMNFDIPVTHFSGRVGEKPYLKEYPSISVSRSYAGDNLVVVAEQDYNIGVDCEKIKDFDKNMIKYFFTQNERKYIESSESMNTAFALLWTRKESYIKCIGRGIDYPINTIDVTPTKNTGKINNIRPVFIDNDEIDSCYINSYIVEDLVISVCSECDDAFPTIKSYEGVMI